MVVYAEGVARRAVDGAEAEVGEMGEVFIRKIKFVIVL
jgi:hypothetical protein